MDINWLKNSLGPCWTLVNVSDLKKYIYSSWNYLKRAEYICQIFRNRLLYLFLKSLCQKRILTCIFSDSLGVRRLKTISWILHENEILFILILTCNTWLTQSVSFENFSTTLPTLHYANKITKSTTIGNINKQFFQTPYLQVQ